MDTSLSLDDEKAVQILVEHQRHRGGCLCGWNQLGASHPEHQWRMLKARATLQSGEDA